MLGEQTRHKLIAFEGQAKPSKIKSAMKWWLKCIAMIIVKTASRNIAFKAARLSDSTFERQSEALMTEAVTVNSPSHEEDYDDVGCNADLDAFKQGAFQGCSSHERSQQAVSRLVLTKSRQRSWDVAFMGRY